MADQRCHASDPELDINAIRLDINPLDEKFNYSSLLGRKEFVPKRVERFQGVANVRFGYGIEIDPRSLSTFQSAVGRPSPAATRLRDGQSFEAIQPLNDPSQVVPAAPPIETTAT